MDAALFAHCRVHLTTDTLQFSVIYLKGLESFSCPLEFDIQLISNSDAIFDLIGKSALLLMDDGENHH